MQRYLRLLLLLNILVIIIGFPLTHKKLAATHIKLQAAVAASNRCTSSKQCAIEETGADPCGGPRGYTIYSTVDPKSVRKIKRLASETRSIPAALNKEDRKKNPYSACVRLIKPEADCKDKKCIEVAPKQFRGSH
ncbi:unnamed protein product [Rotaria sp. Silwood1]|nr:unnamed protein product [Rotaria sp. Silwood1]CAF3923704.1 unnamed protein product [Rotaria sp. Silwood1]CAF4011455.1 unnamed protein product [Rotaria sp. Silwood1]CAF4961956.1 unnamed protein product [Rotaria sp. Silwood1]CAF4994956.1 unnamed protein product [Rotaria sp. Silwood1]